MRRAKNAGFPHSEEGEKEKTDSSWRPEEERSCRKVPEEMLRGSDKPEIREYFKNCCRNSC